MEVSKREWGKKFVRERGRQVVVSDAMGLIG